MRINNAGGNVNKYKFGFKSLRTDKNNVAELQYGTKPISENQKINILSSLNNLVNSSDKQSIEFLLEVADNLAYGQNGRSEFKDAIDARRGGSENPDRENIDWSKILEDEILRAIQANNDEDMSDIQSEYTRIFASKKELTPNQKEILSLRDSFVSSVMNKRVPEDEESLIRAARIVKNIDYFVSSSEISETQKKECLGKFVYLLSDDYNINPQLENHRLQVADEMLNDMLIKTPESDVLTIKDVDQRASGICAAISICRKAVAYEDKSRYMDIVLDELNDSPDMEVFDITDLQSGKKISVSKPQIDYESAMAKGYRIIDTSAHIWMQNAHASGDASILTETYTAFDDDTYNIYDDTSWFEGLSENFSPAKNVLKALIKEQSFINAINKRRKNQKSASEAVKSAKNKIIKEQSAINGALNRNLAEIFEGSDSSQLTILSKNMIAFCKEDPSQNEVRFPQNLAPELRQKIFVDYIKEQMPSITQEQEEKLQVRSKKLLSLTEGYVELDKQLTAAKNFNTKRSKYRYYRNLFQAAAAHRLAVEADVNMPDGVVKYEKFSGIPAKDVRVKKYLNSLKNAFSSDSVRTRFKDENGTVPSQDELEKELDKDIINLETNIPASINVVINELYGIDFPTLLSNMLKGIANNIADGDTDLLSRYSQFLQVKQDKNAVLQSLKKQADKMDKSPSNADIYETVRILGFEDTMQAASIFVYSFYGQLKDGISQDEYERLEKQYGKDNLISGLEARRLQFENLQQEYQNILDKWDVPSSRNMIIDSLTCNNMILSREKLDKLKSKFDKIGLKLVRNEKISDLNERRKANEDACVFSQDEIEIFEQIEKALPFMRKYSKRTYQELNKLMFDDLERQYAYIGMLNGQFWVREEGSSGLSSNEQVRILEQMTGKPYRIEYNAEDAAKIIQLGQGSGILSTSVDDKDYAFHAQYVPSVTKEEFIDPITGEKTVKDVMWTDNSWGRSETESFWNGHNGHLYTDYARGFGWKDGFILNSDHKIGLPVGDIHCAVGYAGKNNEKFGLFSDVILPGIPTATYQKLYKMFNYIFEMNSGSDYLDGLEKAVENGEKIDIDYLVGIDDVAGDHVEKLANRIKREIKSKADFDKLSDDDEIRIVMNQLALTFASDNPLLRDKIIGASTLAEIEELKQEMFEEHIDVFSTLIAKSATTIENLYAVSKSDLESLYSEIENKFGVSLTPEQINDIAQRIFFDEESSETIDGSIRGLEQYLISRVEAASEQVFVNKEAGAYFSEKAKNIILENIDTTVRIKSLDSPVLQNNPLCQTFITAIDKYLEPTSNEEVLNLIKGLQEANYELAEGFINALEPEDVGLELKDPYDYLRRYLSDDTQVEREFSEIVASNLISEQLKKYNKGSEEATPADLYRTMHVKLADMDVQKYVKNFKAEAFAKYKLRQAFPQPVVFSDEDIRKSVSEMLNKYFEQINSIKSNQYIVELLDLKNKFKEKYSDSQLYTSLYDGVDVNTDDNKIELVSLINDLHAMHDFLKQDESLTSLQALYADLTDEITQSKVVIDGKKVSSILHEIDTIYDDWELSNIRQTRFEQNSKDELRKLRENIRIFVTTAVEPKYRDEAARKIKEIIALAKRGAPSEYIDTVSEELKQFIVQKHITKNPTVLLSETVRLLQDGKKGSDEYEILKSYLLSALKVAQQTKVQYKLVQNQHEGISSKTKDLLSLFEVSLTDGSKASMDSLTGMLYLIEQLRNQKDNNITLNLFLEQSGLTEYALKALIENFEIEKSKALVDEQADFITQCIDEIMFIGNILDDYFNKSKIEYKSFEDAFTQITNYVKRKTQHMSESPILASFVSYMQQVKVTESNVDIKSKMFKDIIASVVNAALEFLSDNVNYKLDFLDSIPELLEDRANLLYEIKVPAGSSVYEEREEFIKKYNETMDYISQVTDRVYKAVENSKIKSVADDD